MQIIADFFIDLLGAVVAFLLLWGAAWLLKDVLDVLFLGNIGLIILFFLTWWIVALVLRRLIKWLTYFVSHESNHMLYPLFSWSNINEVVKMREKYGKKSSGLFDKIHGKVGLYEKSSGLLDKENLPFSENFKKILKQYIEYKNVSELCWKESIFMIRKNWEIIEDKTDPDKVYREYYDLERAYEDKEFGKEFIYSLGHNTKPRIEKEYQSELKRLEKVKAKLKK